MRKIREILRLLWECKLSQRQIATCCGISKTAVAECATRARHSGVSREAAAELSDTELEQRLYPPSEATATAQRPAVDWPEVHQQLKGKSVTLQLLWEEYREREPLGGRGRPLFGPRFPSGAACAAAPGAEARGWLKWSPWGATPLRVELGFFFLPRVYMTSS